MQDGGQSRSGSAEARNALLRLRPGLNEADFRGQPFRRQGRLAAGGGVAGGRIARRLPDRLRRGGTVRGPAPLAAAAVCCLASAVGVASFGAGAFAAEMRKLYRDTAIAWYRL